MGIIRVCSCIVLILATRTGRKMDTSPPGQDFLIIDEVKEWHHEVSIELRNHLVFKL